MNSKIFQFVVRLIFATVFLTTGGLFIYHHDLFQERLYDYIPLSWMMASLLARILIAAWLFFGAHLLYTKLTVKKKWITGVLLTFVFLDCFVFTHWMVSKPFLQMFDRSSLILAAPLIFLLLIVIPAYQKVISSIWLPIGLVVGSIAWVTLVNPIQSQNFDIGQSDYEFEQFPYETFQKQDSLNAFQEEKTILAFLSTTCPHCNIAARRLCITFGNKPEQVKCYFDAHNTNKSMNYFFESNGNIALNFQYLQREDYLAVVKKVPTLFVMENGKIVGHYSGSNLSLKTMDYLSNLFD